MSAPHTMPEPPELPFQLEPGDTPARLALTMGRARGWLLILIAALAIGAGALNGGLRGAAVAALGVAGMALMVAVIVFVSVRIISGHRITVTHTELIVQRLRRRTLPRVEAGDLVVGYFTVRAGDPAALQACFTTRHGQRFASVTISAWPTGSLLKAAAALGVAVRKEDLARDRLLKPMWIRRPVLFRFGVAAATVVGTLGFITTVMGLALVLG